MLKILITGGAGFIGSNLSIKLVELGHEVTVIDSLSKQIHGNNPENESPLYLSIIKKVNFIKGDINDYNLMSSIIKDNDIIVHLAAETGTGQSMYEIRKYTETNILGTANILDILANTNHSIKKVIVASSRAIYGEGKYWSSRYNKYVFPTSRKESDMLKGDFENSYREDFSLDIKPTDENSKIHPTSIYGITKQNQESMVMNLCKSLGIAGVSLRYQNVYGEGQSLKNPYTGILSIFSNQILQNKEINIFEDGKESRDFVHIDDVVDATILCIENDESNDKIYNIGTGTPTTVVKVTKKLFELYGVNSKYKITGNFRLGDIRHNYADISKIKNDLGFIPKINFDNGIKRFTDWVKSQKIECGDDYQNSLIEMKEKGLFKS